MKRKNKTTESENKGGAGGKKAEKESGRKSAKRKAQEKKDHLLQTRITPTLYDKVVDRAEALKIPVSNLIRIILEDSVKLVDGVVDEGLNIAGIFTDRKSKTQETEAQQPTEPLPAAAQPPQQSYTQPPLQSQAQPAAPAPSLGNEELPVAWQAVVIGRRAVCGDCGRPLYPAEQAHMGLGTDGRPLLFACPACFQASLSASREVNSGK